MMTELKLADGTTVEVHEMYLCETEQLFLHPDQLYRFIVHPTCRRCKEIAIIGDPSAPNTEPPLVEGGQTS